MSDLVGNPEDRFSRVAAHIRLVLKRFLVAVSCFLSPSLKGHLATYVAV